MCRLKTRQPLTACVLAVACTILVARATELKAQEITVELDPAITKIEFTLPATLHTVHGTFQLKSGTVHFNPTTGAASGVVIADARSAQTGNKSRDQKMHREVLESERYPEIRFTPTKILGPLALQGESSVQLEGVFQLHGSEHPVVLNVAAQIAGGALTARTQLTVPYVAWGLKNPSTLFLHVSDRVQVQVSASGHLTK